MAINLPPDGPTEPGWPWVNYAQEQMNFNAGTGTRTNVLSIPRFKFTYLVEFQVNELVFNNPTTNIREFLNNGKIYTHLRNIDHPKPTITTETLRSQNKWIKVPTKMEYPPAQLSFHDDSTSVVQALWKEHTNFYSHVATVGQDITTGNTRLRSNDSAAYQFTHKLTGEEVRSHMGDRPSLGMKLKPNDMRHFFESIVIYDLGTEPDGINVYWFHNPIITSWDHENLDKEDRTGNVGVNCTFEYESYYWTLGKNRAELADYIQQILGYFPTGGSDFERKDGIGREVRTANINQRAGGLADPGIGFGQNNVAGFAPLTGADLGSGISSPFGQLSPEELGASVNGPPGSGIGQLNSFTDGPGVTVTPLGEESVLEPLVGVPVNSETGDRNGIVANNSITAREDLARLKELQARQGLNIDDDTAAQERAEIEVLNRTLTDRFQTERQRESQFNIANNSASALDNTKQAAMIINNGFIQTPRGAIKSTGNLATDERQVRAFDKLTQQDAQLRDMIDQNLEKQVSITSGGTVSQSDPRLVRLRQEQETITAAIVENAVQRQGIQSGNRVVQQNFQNAVKRVQNEAIKDASRKPFVVLSDEIRAAEEQ